MTTVNAAAYAPDADGDAQRKATWQDTLVVVSDGLWLLPKTQADIDRMVIAEQQRYAASGAEALINKVNSRGGSAAQWVRKIAVQMVAPHAKSMAEANDENWSDTSTAMHRAALWSDDHCALLEKTLQSNLQHANGMIQALLRHSLPVPGETQTPSAQVQTTQIGSTSTNPQTITETVVSVGMPEGSETEEIPTAPVRVIEAMDGGLYVSRLSIENINLGYRHMVLDE